MVKKDKRRKRGQIKEEEFGRMKLLDNSLERACMSAGKWGGEIELSKQERKEFIKDIRKEYSKGKMKEEDIELLTNLFYDVNNTNFAESGPVDESDNWMDID